MTTQAPPDLELAPLAGEARPLSEWVTNFHLVLVVLDPYTNESAWLLETAGRILRSFAQADCRVGFAVTAKDDDARRFLGPWATEFLTFADPDRDLVKAFEIEDPAHLRAHPDRPHRGVEGRGMGPAGVAGRHHRPGPRDELDPAEHPRPRRPRAVPGLLRHRLTTSR